MSSGIFFALLRSLIRIVLDAHFLQECPALLDFVAVGHQMQQAEGQPFVHVLVDDVQGTHAVHDAVSPLRPDFEVILGILVVLERGHFHKLLVGPEVQNIKETLVVAVKLLDFILLVGTYNSFRQAFQYLDNRIVKRQE